MIELGKTQELVLVKQMSFGAYLAENIEAPKEEQILLPAKQVPEDVQDVMPDVFRHRLILKSRVRLTAQNVDRILADICETVPVPEKEYPDQREGARERIRRRRQ